MTIHDVLITALGMANVVLAVLLVYYTLRSSNVLKGANAQYFITIGTILLVVLSLYLPIQHFFFGQVPNDRPIPLAILLTGIVSTFAGMAYSGVAVRKAVGKPSWLQLLRKFHYGIFRLLGIGAVAFFTAPLWLALFLGMFEVSPELFVIATQISFAAFFVMFLNSEGKLYRSTQPSKFAVGEAEEELMRTDLRTLRAYSDLTGRYSAAVTLVTGADFLREILEQVAEKHELIQGCDLSEKGFLKIESAVETILKMDEKDSLPKINSAFSELNSRIINLYGAVTSKAVAKRTFENIYKTVKGGYSSLENFPEISKGLPPGVLEEEKIIFARKEELEQKVRERTAELERTVAELEEAEYGRSLSEKRFKGLVSMLPEPIFETDKEGSITFLNLSGYDIFGYSPKDVDEGLSLSQLLVKEERDRLKSMVEQMSKEKKMVSGEFKATTKEGGSFNVLVRISPMIYAEKPVGMRGVIVDVTDRKRAEDIRRENLIDVLRKLQQVKKAPPAVPDRIKQIQAEAIDTIKRHIIGGRPSPIVEAYRELLTKPRKLAKKRVSRAGKKLKKAGKKRKKTGRK